MLAEGRTPLDHHRATIDRAVARLRIRDDVLAVLVGGSIAHGFATAASDVDLMVVVSNEDWERRLAAGDVTELDLESPTWDGGYVDSKYTSVGFIREVAARGSEPARFAFEDAIVAWTRIDGLDDVLRAAARYPMEGEPERIRTFRAQLAYWHWLSGEAHRSGNDWLRRLAASNVVLFAGRLVLIHNHRLYPGFKWLLRVLADVPDHPQDFRAAIDRATASTDPADVDALVRLVDELREWDDDPHGWGARFMVDTELAWMHGPPTAADR